MPERPVSNLNKPDAALELTLRPSLFSEFTGQPKVKERLNQHQRCVAAFGIGNLA